MIFKSDKSSDGYDEGLRQARANEPKDHRTAGLLKAAILPLDHSFQSYMDGLNRGYEAGLAERTVQKVVVISEPAPQSSTPAKPTTNTTMSRDTIGAQIEALENLRNFLKQFAAQLSHEQREYYKYVEEVLNIGGVERQVERYQVEFMEQNLQHISALIQRIQGADIPYIQRETEHMSQAGLQ